MAARPRIAIVGAGRLGSALAVSLMRSGYAIEAVISRPGRASRLRAKKLAKEVHARVVLGSTPDALADVVWFCVPDGEIASAAKALAAGGDWKRRVVLHSSGALTSDELNILRRRGAASASVHPLMTFVRSRGAASPPSLAGVPFAIEGDAAAVRAARRIVSDLGGQAYSIRKSDKVVYHAWGMFVSPLLTSLLATAEQVAAAAGVKRKDARKRVIPIVLRTLVNYASADPGDAFSGPIFSGPIIRGDVATVKKHLRALGRIPAAREVYVALALAALRYLQAKNKKALRQALAGNPG